MSAGIIFKRLSASQFSRKTEAIACSLRLSENRSSKNRACQHFIRLEMPLLDRSDKVVDPKRSAILWYLEIRTLDDVVSESRIGSVDLGERLSLVTHVCERI